MKNMATVLQVFFPCVALAFSLSNLLFAVYPEQPAVHIMRDIKSQPVHISEIKPFSLVNLQITV